jgi:hypothetical protein
MRWLYDSFSGADLIRALPGLLLGQAGGDLVLSHLSISSGFSGLVPDGENSF